MRLPDAPRTAGATDLNARQESGFVRHLECSLTGETFAHDRMRGLSPAGAPLLVRYDVAGIARAVTKEAVLARPPDLWRWREFLPLPPDAPPVTLGETETPLVPVPRLPDLLVKDEGRHPTGSFKARGMAVAISMARHFGKEAVVVPTAGNAGAAAAAYAAAAGLACHVYAPFDTPEVTLREIAYHGGRLRRVEGLIDVCGRHARRDAAAQGWHDLSTLAEPYRLEGKKTIGLELALQLGWTLPDLIYYPTGGGTGFIGMWKAFDELEAIGWIGPARPRMVAVQTEGCHPIRTAFEAGLEDVAEPFSPVTTVIPGVRVPKPLGGRLILSVLRRSGGHAAAVPDDAALGERDRAARSDGISLCPEGGACLAAYRADLDGGRVAPGERAVIFNTANGLKWPMPELP